MAMTRHFTEEACRWSAGACRSSMGHPLREQTSCYYSIEGNKGIQLLSHTYSVLMKSDLAASKAGNL